MSARAMPAALTPEAFPTGAIQMRVTKFADVKASAPETVPITWARLCSGLTKAEERTRKADCPLLKLATFGKLRSEKGSLRHDANVQEVCGIEGDYDGERVSIDEAANKLDALGIEAFFYTSASNGMVAPPKSHGGPRWRVLVPLAQPIEPGRRRHYVGVLNDALGGILAPESFTLSQTYYFGKVRGVSYETRRVHGRPIDELKAPPEPVDSEGKKQGIGNRAHLAETIKCGPGWHRFAARVAELGRKLGTGDGRRDMLKSYIGSRSVRGLDAAEIQGLIAAVVAEFFEPSDPVNEEDIAGIVGWATERDASRQSAEDGARHTASYLGELTIRAATAVAVAAEGGDVGSAFEATALDTLRALQAGNPAEWMRLRDRLKKAGVGITELDKRLRAGASRDAEDENITDKLVALARSRCQFVHDANGEPFAVFESESARQVLHLDSKAFGEYLSHAFYTEHDRAPNEPALRVALSTLRGHAKFEGQQREVFVRVAKTDEGYWLDLCDDGWRCVRITATGWAVVTGDGAPLFTRSASMRPLPVPERGGTLDALWPLVNISKSDRALVLAWMLECLRADTPHVVLELVGEQGSAKSSTQRALRRLIDPNQADLRAAPKCVEDVWIAARNSHMVSLENLSHLHPQYQDALCVLATGGGYSARTLYTNAEETIIDLRKPIVLNGISTIVTAQDLLDRSLHVDLPTIQCRELSSDMERRFEAAQPQLLGALLDLFVDVLKMLPDVTIAPNKRPRMADFAALGEAVFRVNGKPEGEFLTRYNAMRRDGVHRTVDSSPVGAALLAYLGDVRVGWHGKLSQLLDLLGSYRPQGEAWPRSAKGLGDALRRLAPALRFLGFDCRSESKTGGEIRWSILPCEKSSAPCPASPACPCGADDSADDIGGDVGLAGLAGPVLSNPSRQTEGVQDKQRGVNCSMPIDEGDLA